MDARDEALLVTLTLKVRFLSTSQIARTWWRGEEDQLTLRLNELTVGGWLTRDAVTAHPELALEEPLAAWDLGLAAPQFGAVAYKASRRLSERAEQMVIIRATPKAARLFGGDAGVLKLPSVTHDLQVGTLYLRFLKARPEDAADWLSEAALASERQGDVLPDAGLTSESGALRRVIEFVGRYPPERLRRLHDDCESRDLPYELW